MWDKLESLEKRYEKVNGLMADPQAVADYERLQRLAKERSSMEDLVVKYRELKKTLTEIEETKALLESASEKELAELAKEELEALKLRQESLEREIRLALTPKDPNDHKDVIVEIRAGTGGDEASLFAADLFRMYTRYALSKGWHAEVIDSSETGIGGFKEIILEVKGKGAFSRLKHESGVHRVQRIPVTEASGRIHTSTSTIAVLPEAEEVEVNIDPDDLRTDIFHSGGPGGQNVNKVATAVRITHLPTGMIAVCKDERSQLKNRLKAMAVLRARLFDLERRKKEEEITQSRRSQVGSGERAEKIRTYNFPQNRITDHRINLTLHNLDKVLQGELDELIEPLIVNEQSRKLEEALA